MGIKRVTGRGRLKQRQKEGGKKRDRKSETERGRQRQKEGDKNRDRKRDQMRETKRET